MGSFRENPGTRAWRFGVLGALLGSATLGCGNTTYIFHIGAAEEKVEHAKSLDAPRYAPYEYYSAEARMIEAKRQAAEAEYGAAADLADQAEHLARLAIRKSHEARVGGTDASADDAPQKAATPKKSQAPETSQAPGTNGATPAGGSVSGSDSTSKSLGGGS